MSTGRQRIFCSAFCQIFGDHAATQSPPKVFRSLLRPQPVFLMASSSGILPTRVDVSAAVAAGGANPAAAGADAGDGARGRREPAAGEHVFVSCGLTVAVAVQARNTRDCPWEVGVMVVGVE